MGLARRVQMLAKLETSEGVNAAPTSSDVIEVYNPTISETYDVADRQAAGQSIDRNINPPGRSQRQVTFEHDFIGSGAAADPPPWGKLVVASCMQADDQYVVTLAATGMTGVGFQPGEVVQIGSTARRGVCLNRVTHSSGVPSGKLYLCWIKGAIPAIGETIDGESSGSSADVHASTAPVASNKCYRPDSSYTTEITVASWTGSAPPVGTVVVFSQSSASVGAGQVIEDLGAGTDLLVAMQWGTASNGDTVSHAASGGGTATLNAAPTLVNCPSMTQRYNLDGMARDLVGARGDFNLSGEAGQIAKFAFTFTGVVDAHADVLFATGYQMSTIVAPRMIAVEAGISVGNQYLKLPLKRFELALGNQVALDADATKAKGDRAATVSDRDPTLTIAVNKIGVGTADWISRIQGANVVRWGILIGSSSGNKVLLVVPRGQIVQMTDGNADGVATDELQIKCRRVEESGDDSFFLAQLAA